MSRSTKRSAPATASPAPVAARADQEEAPATTHQPGRWARLMDTDVGIIPVPVFALLVGLLVAFTVTDNITGELAMVIGIMGAFAFALGTIGARLPVLRDIGGAAVMVTFVPSFLKYQGWIPDAAVKSVGDFFTSSKVLNLFIAFVIVGSILSLDRTVLVRGFAKIFAPLAAGTVMSLLVGTGVGTALGLGFKETIFFVVVPIMAGGVGEGAIPLTIGYAAVLGADQGDLLARVLPSVLVGNLTAILLAGILSYAGRRKPHLTGNGQLDASGAAAWTSGAKSPQFSVQDFAAAGITAVVLYLAGVLAFDLLEFPAPVVMLVLAVLLKLAHAVTPRLQSGSSFVYRFCLTAVAFPVLFAFSVVSTPWKTLVAGFAPANLVTVVATVLTMVTTGFLVSKWVKLHPIDGAIVTSTHSGMGGAGDIAILSASNRMALMPFAQIATRIGGGITVTLALVAAHAFGL